MRSRSLVAFNTATNAENKIHDDDVAQRFGFSGGLVPGVDVHAYLAWGPASAWGRAWLERGTMSAQFAQPAYDGETVTVEAEDSGDGRIDLGLRNPAGMVVAQGSAALPARPAGRPDPARYPRAPLPGERRPPAPEALAPGTVLGSWDVVWRAEDGERYLVDVREALPLYAEEGVAHPGWVLRQANRALEANVLLGPWIHVGSEVAHHGLVRDGAEVSCRAIVTAEYERKGHSFVELDALVTADGEPVARIDHTSIYLPRQVKESA
ncbi:MAG: hypothetical protein GEV08_09165 [Acidimicrobiia bacterium]|nr:hypothetical protein [Acidimicrobiia bacterium]